MARAVKVPTPTVVDLGRAGAWKIALVAIRGEPLERTVSVLRNTSKGLLAELTTEPIPGHYENTTRFLSWGRICWIAPFSLEAKLIKSCD